MSLHYAALGVLEARPMSGYELSRFFESSARWVWAAPQSQIYPLLKRLETAGLIKGEEQVRGDRLRSVRYSVTEAGLADLHGWLVRDQPHPDVRDPRLLQALFLDMVPPDEGMAVLARQVETLRADVQQWSVHQARLLARDTPLLRERLERRPPDDHERIARLKAHVFAFLIDSARLRIAWLERAAEIVQGRFDSAEDVAPHPPPAELPTGPGRSRD